jgi:L-alanine-DL-glutamate epimerase-like enolase superfamily enzyme
LSERLTLIEIKVPFRRPLETAAGTITSRRSVLVAVETQESVGWGEAPAFPSGRFGTAEQAFRDLARPEQWSTSGPTIPIASAALQAARADAAARGEGVPLYEWLGAKRKPVVARHPIGLLDPERVPDEIAWLEAHGISAIKLKIAPGRDISPVTALRQALPDLDIGVDANAAYRDPADPAFAQLDEAEVSFIEQPFPAEALDEHRALRSNVSMSVCVDEAITSEGDASRIIASGAADVLAVKLNRHGLSSFGRITTAATKHGLGIRIGGTFDTTIGRLHLLAASGLPGVIDAAVGPPSAYLADDVAEYPTLDSGRVTPQPLPGIGTIPNDEALKRVEVRRTTVEVQ